MNIRADVIIKDVGSFFNFNNNALPFFIKGNIKSICKHYNLKPARIKLFNNDILDWDGLFFSKEINKKLYIFSGGRFGYAGFIPIKNIVQIDKYLPMIEIELNKLNAACSSLSVSFLANNENLFSKDWTSSKITYLIAESEKSYDGNVFSFKKSKIKSNISRSLKKARKNDLKCIESINEDDIAMWHKNCHTPRINELNGKIWELDLLLYLSREGSGSLISALNKSGEIVGGCFILKSKHVLELFMMSSTRENQLKGVNYLLTEYIYLLAYNEKIKYINWQSSNPPDSPLVKYKKDWNSEEFQFTLFNKLWDDKLNKSFIDNNFRDCYLYPFSKL